MRTANSKARHLLLEQIPERFRVDLDSTLLSLGSMRLPIGAYALNAGYANDNQFDKIEDSALLAEYSKIIKDNCSHIEEVTRGP